METGKTNTLDAFYILKYVVKLQELGDNFLTAGNINSDKKVNALDALNIQKFVVKLRPISL